MARAESKMVMGYLPIEPHHHPAIISLMMPATPAVKLLDPFAGDGLFLDVAAQAWNVTPYANELDGERAQACIERFGPKQAVASQEVINIFDAAGLKRPDISILSDEFLEDVRHLPQRNLALELLRKLLDDEIKTRGRHNVVQARSFADMLEKTIRRYQNRTIDAAQVITELIDIAKEVRDAAQRGAELGLSEEEMAFYDALAENQSAREVLGDKQLAVIALELLKAVRANVTIDWSVKQGARAKIRVLVKRILRQYGYPPDLQDAATDLVLEQAELLAAEWVEQS